MLRSLSLMLALVAGLFVLSPRTADAAGLGPVPALATQSADSAVTTVQYGYGYRRPLGYGYGRPAFGYRRHFGPRIGYGYRRRPLGFGYGRPFRHRGYRYGY